LVRQLHVTLNKADARTVEILRTLVEDIKVGRADGCSA
jgi:hypothetical protein